MCSGSVNPSHRRIVDRAPTPQRGLAAQIGQGIGFLVRHPVLRMLALAASLNNLVFSAIFALDMVFLTTVVGLE